MQSQRTKGGSSVKYWPRGGAMFRAAHPLAPENAFESYVFPNFVSSFFLLILDLNPFFPLFSYFFLSFLSLFSLLFFSFLTL